MIWRYLGMAAIFLQTFKWSNISQTTKEHLNGDILLQASDNVQPQGMQNMLDSMSSEFWKCATKSWRNYWLWSRGDNTFGNVCPSVIKHSLRAFKIVPGIQNGCAFNSWSLLIQWDVQRGTPHIWRGFKSFCICAALSALFKVDGAWRRVSGENNYFYYAGNHEIHKILKKVDGALGMSSWRNRRAPSLPDNAEYALKVI